MAANDLDSRVSRLGKALPAFSQELRQALLYIEADAASSLTKSRVVLEKLVIALYGATMGQEPRKPLLGDMLTVNQFTKSIERRILSRMQSVRDMGSLGPHAESAQPNDAARVLGDLCDILDWYLQRPTGDSPALADAMPAAAADSDRPRDSTPVGGDSGGQLGPRAARPAVLRTERRPDVQLSLEPWLRLAPAGSPFPDRLLREEPFKEEDQPFRVLREFLTSCLDREVAVGVQGRRPQPGELLTAVDDFWLLFLAALVFDAEGSGPLSWLIRETVKALRDGRGGPVSRVGRLWTHVGRRYCDFRSAQHRPEVLDNVCRLALASAKRDTDYLHRFFTFLYSCLETDPESTRRVAERLKQYDEQLGNDALPAFLERLKYLTGRGIAVATHGIGNVPPFRPKLVKVSGSCLCVYPFETMVTPLTVLDYSTLRGVPLKQVGGNPLDPYVLQVVSVTGANLFNKLSSEVKSLVETCRNRETDGGVEWDVPTAAEWLALAGCEDQPYPWGDALPTPERANLDFGSASRLRPVGAYPRGASRHGALDCCGNVHEIVRFAVDDEFQFPQGFRLAGGCFQTSVRASACQVFRPFKEKQEDNRRNIGLRLVRCLKQDVAKRWQVLEQFLSLRDQ